MVFAAVFMCLVSSSGDAGGACVRHNKKNVGSSNGCLISTLLTNKIIKHEN